MGWWAGGLAGWKNSDAIQQKAAQWRQQMAFFQTMHHLLGSGANHTNRLLKNYLCCHCGVKKKTPSKRATRPQAPKDFFR